MVGLVYLLGMPDGKLTSAGAPCHSWQGSAISNAPASGNRQSIVSKRSVKQDSAETAQRNAAGDSGIPLADSQAGGQAAGNADPEDTSSYQADRSTASSTGSSLAGQSSSDTAGSSTSTGGFETMLGKMVIKTGLVTDEEIEMFNELAKQGSSEGAPRTLSDLLIENDLITSRQIKRLKADFDTRKSTRAIPGYRMEEKLGSGAMATVFRANQLSLDRKVAIKILPRKFSANKDFIERFYKEGRAAAQLNHPNIVQAYDVGRAGEHHYFVMEYVDGSTVHDRLVKDKVFREAEAVEIVMQVTKALQHAHERGFIHRDIKPKNIMLSTSGKVKLADLGLARAISDKEAAAAEAGRAYGTPYYISPEQIRGEMKIGPEADIYGLGATFYHMVTGRVPYSGKNPSEVMRRHLKSPLEPPDHINTKLSAGCAQVIEMMMDKSAAERYHNATDLLEDLELIASAKPPHFAHKSLDISNLATVISNPATEVASVAKMQRKTNPDTSIFSSPLVMFIIVGLGISIVINLILLVLVLSN